MVSNRIVEYVFFFGMLSVVAYLVWEIISPFVSALALSAIIVTICFPLYERIKSRVWRHNETIAALATTIVVFLIVILPVVFVTSALLQEAVSVYRLVETGQSEVTMQIAQLEETIQAYVPNADFNITELLQQSAEWFTSKLGAIFASTASTIFLFFIAMIGSFYFFRDGRAFTKQLVIISPLPDDEDEIILSRLARAVRSVATGTVLVALIQGTLTAVGLAIFGFERAILWGAIASLGALIPSVGTSIVFIPAVLYLAISGEYLSMIGLSVWGLLAVGLIDNLLGPYLISRGNALHPFLVLLSVLGGISLFGPIGFIVGPVIVSLFMVLLELYHTHISVDS